MCTLIGDSRIVAILCSVCAAFVVLPQKVLDVPVSGVRVVTGLRLAANSFLNLPVGEMCDKTVEIREYEVLKMPKYVGCVCCMYTNT
jgi:hypothetical protein